MFEKLTNFVIGNNSMALVAAAQKAEALGFNSHIVTDSLYQDYQFVGDFILNTIEKYKLDRTAKSSLQNDLQPLCLLFGGEPTVKVMGNGLGGRNQHLALYCAIKLKGNPNITLLCGGTDGTDGPTDAAGAIVNGQTTTKAKAINIDPDEYLNQADSYHFFDQVGGHLFTGATHTNVMDIIIALII